MSAKRLRVRVMPAPDGDDDERAAGGYHEDLAFERGFELLAVRPDL